LNEEAKYFISTIRSSTQLMSRLIEDLLQYSRLERSQLRSEPVMIKALVEAILKINESEINTHHFTVKIEIADSPVMADSNGIQMALRNLIENAIKFTKSVPEPTIEIKQTETDLSWTLSVKDNGIGFDMKYSHRIFEIFQRLHRVEDYQGTGIGLAIVSKAMHRMNGKAWAESTPGQGSTFFIEIPKPISNGNN
jgi:light-regulated signal transduction histidine kinase (bacteriophytochrome)